ncbi:glycosyltransferase [Bacillus atrophaeus]|uniref:glycosyltransferase family 2 protein n=1 Tax=Bacillus atrophaeus TaxID=1452 RepID=UPI00227E0824|nr:glycosyltransferase family 2 protein [Bacillus atrophaeus]MCY9198259.1 glycosyltransferase [Bacillus atrophaeus]
MNLSNFFKLNKKESDQSEKKREYTLLNKEALTEEKKVVVVVPVYNAEQYLRKTVDSVILQNIGFQHISLILVDDCSTDESRNILTEYAELYENITVVFLKNNTGTPAFPRNLGIELANAKYITFLDADDWFAPNGVKILFDMLEENNVNYAVGKTIEMQVNGQKAIGKHESSLKREKVSPFSIPHIFYHLGPRARMMNLQFLKDNNIRYPEMKFAEDKQFFMDVLLSCGDIATSTEPIYYLNRMDNNESLTKQTNIMEKTDTNIAVMKYILNKKLDVEKEKMAMNRLIEFDSITRLFDRMHYLKSENKQAYYNKFNEILSVLKKTNYDISETFYHPIHKTAFQLLKQKRYAEIEKLFRWSKKDPNKKIITKDGLAFLESPLTDEENKLIELRMHGETENAEFSNGKFVITFRLFGRARNNAQYVQFQSRNDMKVYYQFNVQLQEDGRYVLEIPLDDIEKIGIGGYIMYVIYNDYERVTLYKEDDQQILAETSGRKYQFYQTVKENLSLKVIK